MLIYAIYLCTMQVQQFHRCMQSLHMPINVSEEHIHTIHSVGTVHATELKSSS